MKCFGNVIRATPKWLVLLHWSVLLPALILPTGCETKTDPAAEEETPVESEPATATFTVIDDEPLAAAIERHLRARSDMDVTVNRVSTKEFQKLQAADLQTDVIVYPVELLHWIVSNKMLCSIPRRQAGDVLADNDILPIQRQTVPQIGRLKFAASMGSPSFHLIFRQDLFEKLGIQPPTTWNSYLEAAKKIAESELDIESPVCEPLKDDWAGQVLLARTAGYLRRYGTYSTLFDIESMEPLIDRPPFVRALEELVSTLKVSDTDNTKLDPASARAMVLDGRAAMTLSWPTKAQQRSQKAKIEKYQSVAVAAIPGSDEIFDFHGEKWKRRSEDKVISVPLIGAAGRLASVARTSKQISFARELIGLLTGREMSDTICTASVDTAPFRQSHLATASRWLSDEYTPQSSNDYADSIRNQNDRKLTMQTVRIARNEDYLAALSEAVREAVSGATAEEALKKAADRWREITKEVGVENQKYAYRDCIGANF